MFSYINPAPCSPPGIQQCRDSKYDRDTQEDLKTAIDYLFEFKQKLSKLHPDVTSIIEHMLQARRY
jgi:hypothetical protein